MSTNPRGVSSALGGGWGLVLPSFVSISGASSMVAAWGRTVVWGLFWRSKRQGIFFFYPCYSFASGKEKGRNGPESLVQLFYMVDCHRAYEIMTFL
ncbi:conserved hypothetical protein [Coccidioides posadasii str. Silveira]|uniref:Uncharacterized protein n=1 Tax=Coccidioides posadasii (strain RMSCC 757 / Silveira) TaxID=443226 RepID=E9CY23_COCPS|nr:conserved hypothetical protein [Coccidioides posadasii str. Silveira]